MSNPGEFEVLGGKLTKYRGPGGDVIIPAGVTEIGWRAFYNCGTVTQVTIPEGVTEIGGYAFEGCRELAGVTIPRSVTKLGCEAFAATALYREEKNWDKGILYLDDVLVKAKAKCGKRCRIREGTRVIAGKAFASLGVAELSFPDSLEHIGSEAFEDTEIEGLQLPKGLRSIGISAFAHCKSLKTLTIPGGAALGSFAFQGCSTLEEAVLEEGAEQIAPRQFDGCGALKRVMLPASMKEVAPDAFQGCAALEEIQAAEGNPVFRTANGALLRREGMELVLAPAGIRGAYPVEPGVKAIGQGAFSGCGGMTEVLLPESVERIGEQAFSQCRELKELRIPGSVKRLEKLSFFDCGKLEKVTLGEGVEEIGEHAFFLCSSLRQLRLPASLRVIRDDAFEGCAALEQFELAAENGSFSLHDGCLCTGDGSEMLLCPVKTGQQYRIPEGVKRIGRMAFSNCSEIRELTLPRGLEELSDECFRGCTALRSAAVYDDYPGDNIGRLFGYMDQGHRTFFRVCRVKVLDAKTDAPRYEVLLVNDNQQADQEIRGANWWQGSSIWGRNGSFDFAKLDALFDKYKEMPNRLMTAWLRLRYPLELDGAGEKKYRSFIKRNGIKLLPDLIRAGRADVVSGFLELGAAGKDKIDGLIEQAAQAQNAEMAALLLDYKQKHFKAEKPSFKLEEKGADKLWEVKKETPELVWRYLGTDTELTLPLELNGTPIRGVADTVFKKPENYDKIEKLVVPEGYRSIGRDAFSGCVRLKELSLPGTLEELGENCFAGCISLEKVEIPKGLKRWWPGSFAGCSSLREVRLPEGLGRIPDQSFLMCQKLGSIPFPASLQAIGTEAFRGCTGLREIDLGENVSYLGERCFYLARLETVIIRSKKLYAGDSPCFDYPRYVYTDGEVQAIGLPQASRMPLCYLGLKNEELAAAAGREYLKGTSVCAIGELKAFPKIADYRYSNMSFAEFVERLGGSCGSRLTKTTDLAVCYRIDEENASIQRAIKQGCAVITELDFLKLVQQRAPIDLSAYRRSAAAAPAPAAKDDPYRPALMKPLWSYTELPDGTLRLGAYKGTETRVEIPPRIGSKSVTVIGKGALSPGGPRAANEQTRAAITEVSIPEGVVSLEEEALQGCRKLVQVRLPGTLRSIGSSAFRCCGALEEICIPDGVEEIAYGAFEECAGLKAVTLPGGLQEIGSHLFSGCVSLESLEIPAGVTAVRMDAFAGCTALRELKLPEKLTLIEGGAFADCASLRELRIPEGTRIIASRTFQGCTGLADEAGLILVRGVLYGRSREEEELCVPAGVTAISGSAFENSKSLRRVILPESVRSIAFSAFRGCTGLEEVRLNEGLTEIEAWAFDGCAALRELTLPASLEKVNGPIIRDCHSLHTVKVLGADTKFERLFGEGVFDRCPALRRILAANPKKLPEKVQPLAEKLE